MRILNYIKATIVLSGVIINCGFSEDFQKKDLVPIVSLEGYTFKLPTEDLDLEDEAKNELMPGLNMEMLGILPKDSIDVVFDLSLPHFEGNACIDHYDCSNIKIVDCNGTEWEMDNNVIMFGNQRISKYKNARALGVVKGIPVMGKLAISGRLKGVISVYESEGEKFLISDILKEGIEIDGTHCDVVIGERNGETFIDIKLPNGADYDIRMISPISESELSAKQKSEEQDVQKVIHKNKQDKDIAIENMILLLSKKIAEIPFDVPVNECINFKIKLNP